MSFIVSARKYRPQHFNEVIGQSHITDTLLNALSKDKLAHAFLFTGPRGVGKTTCARILAKVINCENVKDGKACNQCASCNAFNANASFNIVEVDGASHNGVEQIRNLIDQVRFQPQHGRYKVFIIDEVHMLTSAAFNAFLKTLEEPPPYAIFILATTEKHKIIPTILSRCQIFDFKRIQIKEIVSQLNYIADQEKIKIESDALFLIAEKADGALRDALSIFDRIANAIDGEVKYQDVIQKLNILDYDYYFKMTDALLREDGSECLLLLNQIIKNGFEGDHFMNGLSDHLRNLLISKDPETLPLLEVGESLRNRYAQQSITFTTSHLLTALDIANECDLNYQRAKNKRLHTEIALLKLAFLHRIYAGSSDELPLKEAEKKTPELKEKTPPQTKQGSQIESSSHAIEPELPEQKSDTALQNTPAISSIDRLIHEVKQVDKNKEQEAVSLSIDKIEEVWSLYTDEITSPSIKSVLHKAILSLDEKDLIVEVPSQIANDIIMQETVLMQEIRSKVNTPGLNLNVKINKDKFPDVEVKKPKKYLTVKEKYDELNKSNPLLKELIKKLDLKIDNDY